MIATHPQQKTAERDVIAHLGEVLADSGLRFDQAKFNQLCNDFVIAKAAKDEAQKPLDEAQAKLQVFVDKFGAVPEGADKTVRCESNRYKADVTRGMTVETLDHRVAILQRFCSRNRLAQLFASLFSFRIEYSLRKGASEALKAAKLTDKTRTALTALYALCFDATPKAPALKVTDLVIERKKTAEKEAAKLAAAATKKAAKKGGR
jgi:hypothetical protein